MCEKTNFLCLFSQYFIQQRSRGAQGAATRCACGTCFCVPASTRAAECSIQHVNNKQMLAARGSKLKLLKCQNDLIAIRGSELI